MFSFFKAKKQKAIKRGYSFYHRENLIQTVGELKKLFDNFNYEDNLKSDSKILIQDLELNSITEKELVKNLGQESYILDSDSGIEGHKIYFFRFKSETARYLIQFHFIKGQFIFAGNKAYDENLLTTSEKQKIINELITNNHKDIHPDNNEFVLEDPKGNLICTCDNVYLYIKYIVNSPFIKEYFK